MPEANAPSDAELVERACRGETDAFGLLVARYEVALFNFMVRYCGQREVARDLCQETFLKAFRGLPGFRVGAPFKPWLYRVAVNAAHSWSRRAQHRELGMDLVPEPGEAVGGAGVQAPPSAEVHLQRGEDGAPVQRALARLPEETRVAVVLKFVDDFTYEEMSEVLGDGVPALKMRVHRGLARLRELMAKDGGGR